ncbi:MAG TPA: deoxyguanosinetriphosphate triphosphohydrolase [Rhizomicrobium sp.]|jgi:dGTPase|nr:deoxyguanosinetriphosphate triphosphohydrolase [Rhizomicrobium sp.]
MPKGSLIPPLYQPPVARAPFATLPAISRGRFHPEAESATRTCYQRDRDRIIHSAAFRRLKHKTQVFVQHEGDYYRTRLTHSLEVAQIARSLARVLALDEDLAEVLALAHDLGHTPFGHAGEEALNAATAGIGGFDHNAHGLRLVTKLEHRYGAFDGLNLTWETLEGLVKHNGPLVGPLRPSHLTGATATSPAGAGEARLPGPIASFDARWPLDLKDWPSLEAQVAALADDIAYVNHDIDDGLRAELFGIDDLAGAPLAGEPVAGVRARFGELELGRFIGELVRTLMSRLVDDLLTETGRRIAAANLGSAADVRAHKGALAAFSPAMAEEVAAIKRFLFAHMYRHPRVMVPIGRAKLVVAELFEAFSGEPAKMPPDWARLCGSPGDAVTGGVVRDYIAGMTDRYAVLEYARVFGREIAL